MYAAKIAAYARDDKRLEIRLDKEATDHAVYIDTSKPGVSVMEGPQYEKRIDQKYLNGSAGSNLYRVETFRSGGLLPGGQEQQLRCYFVYQCDFANPNPGADETQIEKIGEKRFLQKATKTPKRSTSKQSRMQSLVQVPSLSPLTLRGLEKSVWSLHSSKALRLASSAH